MGQGRRYRVQAEGCDWVKHEEEHDQRDAQADQPIPDETPRPVAFERSGREVSRDQEQEAHKVGLVDKYKNEQHEVCQRVVVRRLHVIEGRARPVDDCQVVQNHERDQPGPQVVG